MQSSSVSSHLCVVPRDELTAAPLSPARSKAQELRAELQVADKKDKGFAKKKTVLKKIVANMTMGNDSRHNSDCSSGRMRHAYRLGSGPTVPRYDSVHGDSGSGNQEE